MAEAYHDARPMTSERNSTDDAAGIVRLNIFSESSLFEQRDRLYACLGGLAGYERGHRAGGFAIKTRLSDLARGPQAEIDDALFGWRRGSLGGNMAAIFYFRIGGSLAGGNSNYFQMFASYGARILMSAVTP